MKSGTAVFEDRALIEMTLAGQTACFDVLMDRHQSAVRKRIRSIARTTKDEDDLVQEVFLKAWRHLARFRSDASFRTWIMRIAVNEVLQLYRRERHIPACPSPADLDALVSKFESPQQSLERTEATLIVRSAIARLPAIYSQILVLRDLKQLSETETARWIQGSIPMVKSRLLRARKMLLAAIKRQSLRASKMRERTVTNTQIAFIIESIGRAA
jgi:RNA polymerase sigma-70 factor, ECF subfamily